MNTNIDYENEETWHGSDPLIMICPKIPIQDISDTYWTTRLPKLIELIDLQRNAQPYLRSIKTNILAEANELYASKRMWATFAGAIGIAIYSLLFWLIIGQHWFAPVPVAPSRIAIAQEEKEVSLVSFTNNIEEAQLAKWYIDPNQMTPNMPITVTAGFDEPAFEKLVTCQDATQLRIDGRQIPRVSYRFLDDGVVFHKITPADFAERQIDTQLDQTIWVVIEAKAGTELSGPGRSLYNNTLFGICTSLKLFWDEDHRGPNTLLIKNDDLNWSVETIYEQEGEDIAPEYELNQTELKFAQ